MEIRSAITVLFFISAYSTSRRLIEKKPLAGDKLHFTMRMLLGVTWDYGSYNIQGRAPAPVSLPGWLGAKKSENAERNRLSS